jgi:hypothetical protein
MTPMGNFQTEWKMQPQNSVRGPSECPLDLSCKMNLLHEYSIALDKIEVLCTAELPYIIFVNSSMDL